MHDMKVSLTMNGASGIFNTVKSLYPDDVTKRILEIARNQSSNLRYLWFRECFFEMPFNFFVGVTKALRDAVKHQRLANLQTHFLKVKTDGKSAHELEY